MTYRDPSSGETYDAGNGQRVSNPKVALLVKALRGDEEARAKLGMPPQNEFGKQPTARDLR